MKVTIVGGGKVGAHLASMLLARGDQIKLVELSADRAARVPQDVPADVIITGSGTDPEVLERAGVRQADVVAAVTGADEVNLVVASMARFEFRVRRVVARINDPRNAWMFTPAMGVDAALNQAEIMGHLIAEEMSLGDMMTLLKLRQGRFSLVEEKVHPHAAAVGRAIQSLALPADCTLVAVIRKGALLAPQPGLELQPADEVLAVSHSAQVGALAALLGAPGGP